MRQPNSLTYSINWILKALLPPKFSEDEQKSRVSYRLHMVSLAGMIIASVYVFIWLIFLPEFANRLVFAPPIFLVFLLVLWLVRLGRENVASSFLLCSTWLLTTSIAVTAGGTRSPFFGFYVVIVMSAVLFSGWKTATFYGVLTFITGFIMTVLSNMGLIDEPFATPTSAWLTQSSIMIFVTIDAYIIVRDLRRALEHAQRALMERDQTESAMRKNEENYRRAISAAGLVPYSIYYEPRRFTFLGEGIEELTTYTAEEIDTPGFLKSKILEEYTWDLPGDLSPEEGRAAIRAGVPMEWHNDFRIATRTGENRWISEHSIPIITQDGKNIGAIGMFQDITERKRIEQQLATSEAQLQALLDATTDIAFMISLDGTFLTLNKTMAGSYGKPVDELVGQNAFAEMKLPLRNERIKYFQDASISNEPVRWIDQSETGWWDNSIYPIETDSGTVESFAVYSRDISEQKRLEIELQTYANKLELLVDEKTNALSRAKEQLELILNTTSDALAFAQPNGDIVMTNPAFTTMFQDHVDQYIEGILWSFPDDKQIETIGEALIKVINQNETHRVEARISSKNGVEKDIDLTLIPLSVAEETNGNGILLSCHDVTHLKEVERFKARFVADAVHDLATPIAGLSTRLYLLQHNPERVTDHIRSLENQVQHLRNLLGDLRTLSQLDRRQILVNREMCQINDLLQRVFDTYEPVALNKQQSLKLNVPSSLPELFIDQRQIERVMVNLVSNAINYTSEHKQIVIETRVEEHALTIRIIDEGIGINRDEQTHIFDRFYRTAEARQSVSSGTGLGLAITKELIEMNDGTVTVASEPGQGSTFIVHLPLPTQ